MPLRQQAGLDIVCCAHLLIPLFVTSIGDYYQTKGDFDKALDFYKKAIDINPSFAWYHEQIWRLYFNDLQDYRIGLPYLKKAEELIIKQKDNLEHFYHRVGIIYLNIGDYEKTRQYFKSSLEINPICNTISQYIWIMVIDEEWGKAFDFLDSIIIEVPFCVGIDYYTRFRLHLLQKDFDQAEEYLHLFLKDGNKLWPWDSIDFAYMNKELDREQEALTILNSYRYSLESRLAENADFLIYFNLFEIYTILDNKEEALKYLSYAAELGFKWGYHDMIEIHPLYENLWDDPEFKAIVKRAQDEKAAIRAQVREAEEQGEIDL